MTAAVSFRALERSDLGDLATWLADPSVRRWWKEDADPAAVASRYGPVLDGSDPTEVFVVEIDHRPAGIFQRYRIALTPTWHTTLQAAVPELLGVPTAGIDYLIGVPDLRHRGYGTAAITQFSDELFTDLAEVATIIVNVQQENRASWRALERAGFHRRWAGRLDSDDPADAGPAYLLTCHRHARSARPDAR